MTEHHKIYCKHFGYDKYDPIPCEISGLPAVDISHNDSRGMGGRKSANEIENLMALDRRWHDFLEANPRYYWWFHLVHMHYMVTRKPYFGTKASWEDPVFTEIVTKLRQ